MSKYFKIVFKTLLSIFIIFPILTGCGKTDENRANIVIGSSEIMDIAYPAAKIIARILTINYPEHHIQATVIETAGSGENLKKILNGKIQLALSNSTPALNAYNGIGVYKDYSNHSTLRSIAALYREAVIFVVAEKSGITSLQDIKGKRISVPPPGTSAIGDISLELFKIADIKDSDFTRLDYGLEKSVKLLEEGKIDGFMFVFAQPNSFLSAITRLSREENRFRIVSFSPELIEKIRKQYPELTKFIIPEGMYKNLANKGSIETLGTDIILLTTSSMSDELVYNITKEVYDNWIKFSDVHESFSHVTQKWMVKNSTIPLHEGAYRFYKKIGAVKKHTTQALP